MIKLTQSLTLVLLTIKQCVLRAVTEYKNGCDREVQRGGFPRQLIKENEASCLVDCSSISIGNWSETCKQHIPVLLCTFWRWGAVLYVNIIVSIGIKLASGKMKEIAIFISNQNKILPPCDGRIQRYRTRNQRAQSVCQLVDRGVSLDPQHPNFLPPESHWVLGATYHTHQKE